MNTFSTELPVTSDFSRDAFVHFSQEWLKRQQGSELLKSGTRTINQEDFSEIVSSNGERFQLKEVNDNKRSLIGFKYDKPNGQGLVFRTECVLTKNSSSSIRIRVVCLADGTVPTIEPKTPVLIRDLISNGFILEDNNYEIRGTEHAIFTSEVPKIAEIINGRSKLFLPVVFVSKLADKSTWIDVKAVARALSGLAHVFVEDNVDVSSMLMDSCYGQNPYGGSIGLILPNKGVTRKFYKRGSFDTKDRIGDAIVSSVKRYHATLFARIGTDWSGLDEAYAAGLRKRASETIKLKSDASVTEYMEMFDKEIQQKDEYLFEKDERIKQLEEKLEMLSSEENGSNSNSNSFSLFPPLAEELYPGECHDRLIRMIPRYLKSDKQVSMREKAVLNSIHKKLKPTGNSFSFIQQLKAAGKSGNKFHQSFLALLSPLGFKKVSEKTHIKIEPPNPTWGLTQQTMAKTASDNRAGKNKAGDFISDFDIQDLDKHP